MNPDLNRFLSAQRTTYLQALTEIQNGRKKSHWMWHIFPQIAGLGFSERSIYYGIKNIEEASVFLQHPVLGIRLLDISKAVLAINGKTARQIMGVPDDMKLHSCMTLFASLQNTNPVFQQVIVK